VRARRVKGLDPQRSVARNTRRIVRTRLDEVLSFDPAVRDPSKVKALHDLRIACKRLRYVLEITGHVFGPAGAAAEKEARWLQDVLGEIHDCDVLRPRIERHLETLRESDARALEGLVKGDADGVATALRKAPNRTAYRGLGALESAVVARRALLYERFLGRWLGLIEDGFAPGLEPQLS
jgi:CHAD domain-containing protein